MKLIDWFKQFWKREIEVIEEDPMKYLIVGLGNVGAKYDNTRHNIGFEVVDRMAEQGGATFKNQTLADVAEIKHKGRALVLIKPTTYMNLSGKAVQYWMTKHKVPKDRVLIILDDLNLEYGTLRMRGKGSDGGHNGLKNINAVLQGNNYTRLRVGIGNSYRKGQQIDFVLGKWTAEERKNLDLILDTCADASKSFASIGLKFTMEKFNKSLPLE